MKKTKVVISDKQFEEMQIVYAVLLAVKYHNLHPKDLFESGLNPEWIKAYDVLGRWGKEYWEKRISEFPEDLDEISQGFFKYRKTKKGYVVSTDIVRLRSKEVKC